MRPDWLPPPLTFSGPSPTQDYVRLHDIYQNEILATQLQIESIPVVLNNVSDPSFVPYTYGFTHLITRDDGTGFRGIDYDRACKLNWVVPIIQHYRDPAVSCFWYDHPRGETLALWLEDHDYILILRWLSGTRTEKILITSYSVDVRNRRYYQRLRSRPTSRPL
jgi:hypothetical protein